jgi:hypothetical protein
MTVKFETHNISAANTLAETYQNMRSNPSDFLAGSSIYLYTISLSTVLMQQAEDGPLAH